MSATECDFSIEYIVHFLVYRRMNMYENVLFGHWSYHLTAVQTYRTAIAILVFKSPHLQ